MKRAPGVAYDLRVVAPWPLPELGGSGGSGQVVVRSQRTPVETRPGDIRLEWAGIGVFVVRGGEEILVTPAHGVSLPAVRYFLLGRVFGALLHQRGYFLLHGSVISIDGRAVALMGDHRAGKSTTAGAFVRKGYGFLADDVVALSRSPAGELEVLPAFPQLKLWPDAVEALGLPPDLPRVRPDIDKRALLAREQFVPQAQPLRCAYVLDPDGPPGIEALSGAKAHFALVRHSFGHPVLHRDRPAAHLAECAVVAKRIQIRRLPTQRSVGGLSDVVRAVEDDLASR